VDQLDGIEAGQCEGVNVVWRVSRLSQSVAPGCCSARPTSRSRARRPNGWLVGYWVYGRERVPASHHDRQLAIPWTFTAACKNATSEKAVLTWTNASTGTAVTGYEGLRECNGGRTYALDVTQPVGTALTVTETYTTAE